MKLSSIRDVLGGVPTVSIPLTLVRYVTRLATEIGTKDS
jgi:hypothetical protein